MQVVQTHHVTYFNSAIDFRIGPRIRRMPKTMPILKVPNTDYVSFGTQYGQSLNMGLGLYASGQIHIDTQGYRTWGTSSSRHSYYV